jgi:hypothetical protein
MRSKFYINAMPTPFTIGNLVHILRYVVRYVTATTRTLGNTDGRWNGKAKPAAAFEQPKTALAAPKEGKSYCCTCTEVSVVILRPSIHHQFLPLLPCLKYSSKHFFRASYLTSAFPCTRDYSTPINPRSFSIPRHA